VRIDEIPILVGRAYAVRIPIRTQAGVAAVGHHRLAEGADMGLDRLRIDARKQRIDVAANLYEIHADARKDAPNQRASRPVH